MRESKAKTWAKPWVSSVAWAYPPSYGLTRTERVKRVAELRQRTGLPIREVCALLIWHEYDVRAAVKAWKRRLATMPADLRTLSMEQP